MVYFGGSKVGDGGGVGVEGVLVGGMLMWVGLLFFWMLVCGVERIMIFFWMGCGLFQFFF